MKLIYKRYKTALDILENNKDIRQINIIGGVRAYLDSYSDYTCSLVTAMDKCETIYDEILKDI